MLEKPATPPSIQSGSAAWEVKQAQEAATEPLPQLAELWFFDCVISPLVPRHQLHQSLARPTTPGQLSGADGDDDNDRRRILQRVFRIFDENRDGLVSTYEITRIVQKLGLRRSQSGSVDSTLLAGLATKCDSHVDEQEFFLLYDTLTCGDGGDMNPTAAAAEATSSSCVTLASHPCLQDNEDSDLMDAFRVFDKDGNGLISPSELQSVLCSLGLAQGRHLEACEEMIARVDDNGDGHIDFSEFRKLLRHDRQHHRPCLISSC